jgi:hypothetical protein
MKIRTFLSFPALVLPVVLAVSACSSTATLPQGQRVGEEMQPQTPVRFAVVDAAPTQYFDKPVLVEATVKAVCQKMGCWMQVEDEGHTAMVRWENGCGGKYSFAKDAVGKRVLIQGTFYPKKMDESEVEHLQEEAGGKLAVRKDGYEFNASSVMYLDEPTKSGSSASSR